VFGSRVREFAYLADGPPVAIGHGRAELPHTDSFHRSLIHLAARQILPLFFISACSPITKSLRASIRYHVPRIHENGEYGVRFCYIAGYDPMHARVLSTLYRHPLGQTPSPNLPPFPE
jgi:hypothetical protein